MLTQIFLKIAETCDAGSTLCRGYPCYRFASVFAHTNIVWAVVTLRGGEPSCGGTPFLAVCAASVEFTFVHVGRSDNAQTARLKDCLLVLSCLLACTACGLEAENPQTLSASATLSVQCLV